MTRGYVLVAPSNTSAKPQGGGLYTWITGHSPWDIPLTDLEQPPPQLLAWWQKLPQTKGASRRREVSMASETGYSPANKSNVDNTALEMPSCFQGPIPEGDLVVPSTVRAVDFLLVDGSGCHRRIAIFRAHALSPSLAIPEALPAATASSLRPSGPRAASCLRKAARRIRSRRRCSR